MSILDTIATSHANTLPARLAAHGITLPAEVRGAVEYREKVAALKPTGNTERNAAANAFLDLNPADALAAVERSANYRALTEAWTEAHRQASLAIITAITGNGEAIIADLAALAAPLIADVTRVAQLEDIDPAALLRAKRTKDAHAAATYEMTAASLADLYLLRGAVTGRATYGDEHGYHCGTWRDPRPVSRALTYNTVTSAGETYRVGIRAGAELWFPNPDEADAAARRIRSTEKAAAIKTGA